MMFAVVGIDVGLALLLAALLINYSKLKVAPKAVAFVGMGAVLFILAGVLAIANLGIRLPMAVDVIINIVATIAVIVGTIWAAYSIIPKK